MFVCETGCNRREEPVVTAAALRNLHLINQRAALPWRHTHTDTYSLSLSLSAHPLFCNTRIYLSKQHFAVARRSAFKYMSQLQMAQWPPEELWKWVTVEASDSDSIGSEKMKWLWGQTADCQLKFRNILNTGYWMPLNNNICRLFCAWCSKFTCTLSHPSLHSYWGKQA